MYLPSSVPSGPCTWSEMTMLGCTRDDVDAWVEQRLVRRVLRGVYQRTDVPDTTESRCRAVSLVAPPTTVICDRTAAWLHGVDTFEYRELEIPAPVETWALRGNAQVRREGCSGGRRDLMPDDVMDLDGLRVTTPLRTALDLGARLKRGSALASLDGFMRVHTLTHEDFRAMLPRYRRRGVIQLRQ